MAGGSAGSDVQAQLRAAFALGGVGGLSDGQLLRHCVGTPDEVARAAFDALVTRHGPMVLRVCRRAAGNPHDAQDAFQATFLVLARKAESVRDGESLASWLHGVALRVGGRARADAARRRVFERRSAESRASRPRPDGGPVETWDDLHAEVARLPTRYREPVILCYLEGLSVEAVALKIGCPRGTVLSRLSRARERLRASLTRRGLAPPAVLVAGASQPGPALPPALVAATTQAALRFTGRHATGVAVASAAATTLARGTLKAMMISKLKLLGAITASALLTLGGARTLALSFDANAGDGGNPPGGAAVAAPPAEATASELSRLGLEDARNIEDPSERAETLLRLGVRMGERGFKQAGLETLRLALDAAGAIPPNTGHVSPHPAMRVAQAMAQAGHREEAVRAFREALRIMLAQDERHQGDDWANLPRIQQDAVGHEQSAEMIEAYRRYLTTSEVRFGWDPAVVPILAQAMSGDVAGAFRNVQDRPEFQGDVGPERRRAALLAIAGQLRRGDEEAAGPVLDEAKATIRATSKSPMRTDYQDLEVLAKAETRLGWFDRAIVTARSMTDELPVRGQDHSIRFNQAMTIAEMAKSRATAGDRAGACATAREAIAVVGRIDKESYKYMPRSQACLVLAQNGDIAGALRETSMENPHSMLEILPTIEYQQRLAGDEAGVRATQLRELECIESILVQAREREPGKKIVRPEFDHLVRMTADAARVRARMGDLAAAFREIESLPPGDPQDEALTQLAVDRASTGDEPTTQAILGRIASPQNLRKARIRVAFQGPVAATLE